MEKISTEAETLLQRLLSSTLTNKAHYDEFWKWKAAQLVHAWKQISFHLEYSSFICEEEKWMDGIQERHEHLEVNAVMERWRILHKKLNKDRDVLGSLIHELIDVGHKGEWSSISKLKLLREGVVENRRFVDIVRDQFQVEVYSRILEILIRTLLRKPIPFNWSVGPLFHCFREEGEHRRRLAQRIPDEMMSWGSAEFKFADIKREDGSLLRLQKQRLIHIGWDILEEEVQVKRNR